MRTMARRSDVPALARLAESIAAHLERRRLWWLCGASALYLALTGLLAAAKLMWNDEQYTFYIARQPHVSDIWAALLTGGEQIPPVFHLTARVAMSVFGDGSPAMTHLAIRLPDIIGFWVMCLCLYRFVTKRTPALFGFIALLLPLMTGAYYYAFEARPYAIVLGWAGLALVCWQSAAEGKPRRAALAGLAFSLAAALCNHYYAVLVVFALAVGEAARTRTRRRVDGPVWLAFGAGTVPPLLAFLPLIRQSHTYSSIFWSQPQWGQLPAFYSGLLAAALLPLAAALVVSALAGARPPAPPGVPEEQSEGPRVHELAAAVGFAAAPLVALVLAKLVTHAFTDRYALPAVLGLSCLIAWAAFRLWRDRPLPAVVLLLLLAAGFGLTFLYYRKDVLSVTSGAIVSQADEARLVGLLQAQGRGNDLPIVVADPHTFMILTRYGPPSLTGRLVYLADPRAQRKYVGSNSIDQGMLDLVGPWFRLPVETYPAFMEAHPQFLVFQAGGESGWNWLVPQLADEHRPMTLEARSAGDEVFRVGPPASGGLR